MLKLIGPTTAWLRHASTAAASIVAVFSVLAGLDPDTSAKLLAAIKQALGGLSDFLTALGVLITIGMAWWARWTAKPLQQIATVNALPNAQVLPVDPSQPLTAPAPNSVTMKASSWLVLIGAFLFLGACSPAQDQATASAITTTYAGATNKLTGLLNTSCPIVGRLGLPVEVVTEVAAAALGAPTTGALVVVAEQKLVTTCAALTANASAIAANPTKAAAIVAPAITPAAVVTPGG